MNNADKICSVKDCGLPVESKGFCHKHYSRNRTNGDPLITKIVQKNEWPPGQKWCPKCESFLPLDDFFDRDGKKSGGKDGYCKSCRKKANNEFRIRSPEKYLYKQVKASAKKRGIPFEIELSDIIIPNVCPVFGVKLLYSDNINDVPSLDRVDNSKGYVKGNVRVISWRANNLKSDANLYEMELVLKYMKGEV